MVVVMSWGNSSGERGRCDDKCHSASGPECGCMCGGLYHGSKRDGTFEQVNSEHGRSLQERLAGNGRIAPAQGALL